MKRKIREIALLLVPVAAVVGLIPGARWFEDWREANKIPRIESFELRAPTPWEAYRGADVGYTAPLVSCETSDNDHHMDLRLEFSNSSGGRWHSATPAWKEIAVEKSFADTIHFPLRGRSDIWELRGGLRWKTLLGKNKNARVNIVFDEKHKLQTLASASRAFELQSKPDPIPLRKQGNFVVENVEFTSFSNITPYIRESALEHKFVISIRLTEAGMNSESEVRWAENWKFSLASGHKSSELRLVQESQIANFDEDGRAKLRFLLREDSSSLRGQSASIIGVVGIGDAWPQLLRIQIPQGLPVKLPYSKAKLPFRATLAPLLK